MRGIQYLGMTLISCGVFDSSNIMQPHSANRSSTHSPDKYMIELPFEDGGTNYINDIAYPITSDSLFFIRPKTMRYTIYPLRCLSLHFSVSDEKMVSLLDSVPPYLKPHNRKEIYDFLLKIVFLFTNKPVHYEISVLSNFLQIIDLIIQNNSDATVDLNISLPRTAVLKAKNYIDANYHTKITLKQLSDMVNLSPIYFQRIFTAATGKSPHKYLLDKRLQVAKELLLVSNHSLAEISEMCGFSSQSRFNIVFKEMESLTPKEYKRKNRIESYYSNQKNE